MNLALWPVVAILAGLPQQQGRGPVCVAIDDARDTLPAEDRQAALILLARELERAHQQVVSGDCADRYVLSHVRLGSTITVRLSGHGIQREGTAIGLDDLPPLYNQLVRAILSNSSVGAMNVIDRTNVTTAQVEVRRMRVDSFGYGRLGYGRILGSGGSGSAAMGFGYRAEMDAFGVDFSFLNYQLPSSGRTYTSPGASSGSLFKLEGLRFTNPTANASLYFGGGLSWGVTSAYTSQPYSSASSYSSTSWNGSGLQGELTAGYELPRASELRAFFQVDATLPFYQVSGDAYVYSGGRSSNVALGRRYNPSIALSVGIGWQRHHQ